MQPFQLEIPKPCTQNWDAMTPAQQGRFCNACAKVVVDFTTMSDQEVLNFFTKKNEGEVCGRMAADQIERPFIPIKKEKKNPWLWKFAASISLFFSAKLSAQKLVGKIAYKPPVTIQNKPIMGDTVVANINKNIFKGRVKDENGNGFPNVSIQLAETNKGTITDPQGYFIIKANPGNKLVISAVGYTSQTIELGDENYIDINLTASNRAMLGEMVIVVAGGVRKTPAKCSKPLPKVDTSSSKQRNDSLPVKTHDEVVVKGYATQGKMSVMLGGISYVANKYDIEKKKTITAKIKNIFTPKKEIKATIFPNPVLRGNSFIIKIDNLQNQQYTLYVTNAQGSTVLQKTINLTAKTVEETITTNPTWAAGMYVVSIVNTENKTVYSNKLLIQ